MDFNEWAAKHPQAAAELMQALTPAMAVPDTEMESSEARAQQRVRFQIAKAGALSWRNNVGATPARIETYCPRCSHGYTIDQRPVRYGLANDSAKLNEKIKSGDLVLAIPTRITPEMIGTTIAQFGSVEVKAPGWKYTGKGREVQQAAWLALVHRIGGYAKFSTGEFER